VRTLLPAGLNNQVRHAARLLFLGIILLPLAFPIGEAAGGHFVALTEGTRVEVKTTETLDLTMLKEGETLHLVVAEKVTNEGAILIEEGAPVVATVVLGTMKGQDAHFLKVSGTMAADGEHVDLRTTPESPDASLEVNDTGLLHALLLEGSRWLPAGTAFTVYLSDSYLVEE
jgi:hypothetical protein